jgi:hypothetical protein
MRCRCAAHKRKKEARETYRSSFFPFQFENHWIKFGSSKEGQNDCADTGEKLHPRLVCT